MSLYDAPSDRDYYAEVGQMDGVEDRARMPEKPRAGAQDAKAFAALDSMPAGDRLPLQALFERLQKFGHSDQWALKLATEWYQRHSKLWTGPRD